MADGAGTNPGKGRTSIRPSDSSQVCGGLKEVMMRTSTSRIIKLLSAAVIVGTIIVASPALQGCASNQTKQDFVNEILSIMDQNQASSPDLSKEGGEAFQAYYMSGFTDLESAQRVADTYRKSNEKDEVSLAQLEGMHKPDGDAERITDKLRQGIETMDDGNRINIEELEKAPQQTVEERAGILEKSGEALGIYLEGITLIIDSFEALLDYVQANGLEGADTIRTWLDSFKQEKEGIEQSLSSLEQSTPGP